MEISLFQRQSGRLFDFLYFAKSHGAMRCAYCTLPVSSIRWGALLIAMPRQSNKRGDLRPEFFIMPPFKIAGPKFGAR